MQAYPDISNLLLQAASHGSEDLDQFMMFIWLGLIVGVSGIAMVVLSVLVRRWQKKQVQATVDLFDLQALRELRDRGELTLSQYAMLRQRAIEAYTGGPDRSADEAKEEGGTESAGAG